jgi:hypothetical protein
VRVQTGCIPCDIRPIVAVGGLVVNGYT